jgi:hypothetical protein
MTPSMKKLDTDLRVLMRQESMLKYNFPASVAEIADCPYSSFADVVDAHRNGDIIMSQVIGPGSSLISLLATQNENMLLDITLYGPYLVSLALLVVALMAGKYWLILSVTFPPLSAFLTGMLMPRWLFSMGSTVLAILGLAANVPTMALLFGAYALCHGLTRLRRTLESRVIFSRALELESAFIFLLVGRAISVLDRNYRPVRWSMQYMRQPDGEA